MAEEKKSRPQRSSGRGEGSGEHRQQGRRGPSRRRRRRGPRLLGVLIYILFVIGVSTLLAAAGWVAANDVLALNKEEHEAVITISDEDDFDAVVDLLAENGIIEYKLLFRVFAAVTNGAEKVTAGTYQLDTDMDYRAILTNISAKSGTRQKVTVTIPEGYTVAQTFELLEEKKVSTVEELNQVAAEHDYAFSFLQDIPLGDASRLEGYLFPDTYEFYAGQDALYVINKMLVNFDARLTEEMRQEILDSGKTIHEIITVASMIEKETDGEDQATIASVIYNRLNNNDGGTYGKLQIDATIQYILPERKENLTESDLAIDSPYNTSLYTGLPPGPIANPGMAAIRAAMNPESTGYYYYALGDDGTHHFFKTLSEQQAFIDSQERYQ